jgi:hypothetical protein
MYLASRVLFSVVGIDWASLPNPNSHQIERNHVVDRSEVINLRATNTVSRLLSYIRTVDVSMVC